MNNSSEMNRLARALVAGAVLLSLSTAQGQTFEVDDVVVSHPSVRLQDPEFDAAGMRFVWQDRNNNLWLASIDPATGDIIPVTGRGVLLDTGLAPLNQTLNGPEWAYGSGSATVVYTKLVNDVFMLAAAHEQTDGSWTTRELHNGSNRYRPIGTPPSNTGAVGLTYIFDNGTQRYQAWRRFETGATEGVVQDPTAGAARWVEDRPWMILTVVRDGLRQIALQDVDTGVLTVLTNDEESKNLPYMWWAPEYGDYVLLTMLGGTGIGIYREVNGVWTRVSTMAPPPTGRALVHSPEPFVFNGRSYLTFVATDKLSSGGGWIGQPVGPTDIWIAGIDPNAPFFRRVSSVDSPTTRIDPEAMTVNSSAVIYYSERIPETGQLLLRRAATGL